MGTNKNKCYNSKGIHPFIRAIHPYPTPPQKKHANKYCWIKNKDPLKDIVR